MAQYFTTNTLIDSIKRRTSVPENQSTFTTQDFIDFANEELSLNIVPSLLSLHEDYLLFFEEIDLEEARSEYPIPTRAVGNKLRDVQYIDSNNNQFEMTRISVGDIPDYQGAFTQNHAYTFYVQNNQVVLLPPIRGSASGKLRFYYYIRPSEIVTEEKVGIITSINTTTGVIGLDSVPDAFAVSDPDNGPFYDLYMHRSPHRPMKISLSATSVDSAGKTITFSASDLPTDLVIGDHVSIEMECKIPQIPSDLHVLLAQYVAERVLESIGDTQGLQNAKVKSREMEAMAGNIIDSRVEEAPQKLVNRNGLLRYGLHSKRYRRRN